MMNNFSELFFFNVFVIILISCSNGKEKLAKNRKKMSKKSRQALQWVSVLCLHFNNDLQDSLINSIIFNIGAKHVIFFSFLTCSASEIAHFQEVVKHPAFKADPLAAISEHIKNAIQREHENQTEG